MNSASGSASVLDADLEVSLDGPPVQEGTVSVSRHEKSLGLLTSKFVALLQTAEDGILDLKSVSVRGVTECESSSIFLLWLCCPVFCPILVYLGLVTTTRQYDPVSATLARPLISHSVHYLTQP